MKAFFHPDRLLVTLIVLFGIFFGLTGTILKYTAFRSRNIEEIGIAYPFIAIHDGLPSD